MGKSSIDMFIWGTPTAHEYKLTVENTDTKSLRKQRPGLRIFAYFFQALWALLNSPCLHPWPECPSQCQWPRTPFQGHRSPVTASSPASGSASWMSLGPISWTSHLSLFLSPFMSLILSPFAPYILWMYPRPWSSITLSRTVDGACFAHQMQTP